MWVDVWGTGAAMVRPEEEEATGSYSNPARERAVIVEFECVNMA
jgi:hypothetical protein